MDSDKDQTIKELTEKVNNLESKLKKYTNPERNKKYYQKNKETVIEKANERLKTLSKEIKSEYNKTAYEKRKMKRDCS